MTTGLKARIPRLQTFSSLKHRDYRLLWSGTFALTAGDWIQQMTVAWLMYDMTGSALLVGILQGVRGIPILLIGPMSGVFADRVDRRRLLLWNQVFLASSALALAIIVATGRTQPWHLVVFSALNGAGLAIVNPLRQTLVANTVPAEELPSAVGLSSMAFNVNRALGPAIGGVLIAFTGPATNFFIQAGCYACVALLVLLMRIRKQDHVGAGHPSPLKDLKEGLVYVFKDKPVMAAVVISTIPSIFLIPFATSLMPVFTKDVLHQGPDGLGVVLAAIGVGGVVGTLASASAGHKTNVLQVAMLVLSAVALIAASLTNSMAVALPLLAVQGVGQAAFYSMNLTFVQSAIPDQVRGRVMSIVLLNLAIAPFGSFLSGAAADLLGSPLAMLIGGVLTIGMVLVVASRFKMSAERASKAAVG